MAIVFPVMYVCLTPLAIVTLGTTSWETRGAAPKKKAIATKVPAKAGGG
jgi:hypothetical protein